MKNQQIDKRQKKMLLMLPLLALPFLALFFWALGGGKASANTSVPSAKGLNTQLPVAQLKSDSTENKLSFYEQAEKDSLKLHEAIKDDPNYHRDSTRIDFATPDTVTSLIGNTRLSKLTNTGDKNTLAGNEEQLTRKLNLLKQQLNKPETTAVNTSPQVSTDNSQEQLTALMQKMNSGQTEDPELKQLSTMLDKIQEIQNPGLARQRLTAESEKNRGQVFPVSSMGSDGDATLMQDGNSAISYPQQPNNGFFGLQENNGAVQENAIPAVIHETQTLTSGATVKMRLLADLFVAGQLIPKGNFIYGTCYIEGERLNIDVKSVRRGNSVFPVFLKVFDQDGLAGVHVPGAITRDAAKEGADQAIQGLDFYSMSPSVGAQAASAGIQAAKGLFSKKAKLIKVTVKAGYSVLLLNANQLNQ